MVAFGEDEHEASVYNSLSDVKKMHTPSSILNDGMQERRTAKARRIAY